MTDLLLKPAPGAVLHSVAPETLRDRCPNWAYVGFEAVRLAPGETITRETGGREHLVVILTGRMTAAVGGEDLGEIGGRMDIFARDKAQ